MQGPSPQPKLTPYLTVIPSRRPVQKTHSNIGHAKNAINGKIGTYRGGAECDMQLYEHVNGDWKLLYSIKQGEREAPWRKEEFERERRRKEAAEVLKRNRTYEVAVQEGHAAFTKEYGGTEADVFEERTMYVSAFVDGYLKGWDEAQAGNSG